jgi:hypothetical protein
MYALHPAWFGLVLLASPVQGVPEGGVREGGRMVGPRSFAGISLLAIAGSLCGQQAPPRVLMCPHQHHVVDVLRRPDKVVPAIVFWGGGRYTWLRPRRRTIRSHDDGVCAPGWVQA